MRIAMLSPVSWRTPPRHYGPWEWIVSLLTEGLVAQGIDVTLFATGDSQTSASLRWVLPRPYSEDPGPDPKVAECMHISALFEDAGSFDLIHNHFDFLPLTYTGLVETPVITTIHGFSSPKILPVYQKYDSSVYYVSISEADRHPSLSYSATIHHGIPVKEYPFREEEGDYLLFLGRIHPDKGTHEAIRLAREVAMPLVIAGIVQDNAYYEKSVAPFVDGKTVSYIGPVGPAEKGKLLAEARVLLHLINFNEPFGLSVIEAMACGTPVIAKRRGSMDELISDGETGFLVDSLNDAANKFAALSDISRSCCRKRVEENFSVDIMVERYLEVYHRIIAEGGGMP